MSFNTWYKPFNAQKKNEDDTPQEPGMQYCNVAKDGKTTNVCQQNIMNEIMAKIEEGFEVIFLQEFTTRIQDVFDKCNFSDTKQTPFTMAYTPPGGKFHLLNIMCILLRQVNLTEMLKLGLHYTLKVFMISLQINTLWEI